MSTGAKRSSATRATTRRAHSWVSVVMVTCMVIACNLHAPEGKSESVQPIRAKAQEVAAGMRRWQAEGRNPAPLRDLMKEVKPLLRAGRIPEAEAKVDEALALIHASEGSSSSSPPGSGHQATSTSSAPSRSRTGGAKCVSLEADSGVLRFGGREGDEVSNGRIDPAIEEDPTTGRLWMVYSGVQGGPGTGKPFRISQRLAYSDDGGASWCDHSTLVPVEEIPKSRCPPGARGPCHFNMEVATLAYVPFAPASTRWKYLYFQSPAGPRNVYPAAWYALREAASPPELVTAAPRKMFAGRAYDAYARIRKWVDQWPGGPPQTLVNRFDGGSDCFNFTEIGSEVVGNHLYVSLLCAAKSVEMHRTVLLRTSDPGLKSWEWVGQVLRERSASKVRRGSRGLSASDLFTGSDGVVRIVTSPTDGKNGTYAGCAVFAFEDIDTGKLVDADGDGLPDLQRFVPRPSGSSHAGMCTFFKGSKTGLIFSQRYREAPMMRLRATRIMF